MKSVLYSRWLKAVAVVLLFANILLGSAGIFASVTITGLTQTYGSEEYVTKEAWMRVFYHRAYYLMDMYFSSGREPDLIDGENLSYAVLVSSTTDYQAILDGADFEYLYLSADFDTSLSTCQTGAEDSLYVLAGIEVIDTSISESVEYYYYDYATTLLPMLTDKVSLYSTNSEIYMYRSNHSTIFEYYIYAPGNMVDLLECGNITSSANAYSCDSEVLYDADDADNTISYRCYWVVGSVRSDYMTEDAFSRADTLLDYLYLLNDHSSFLLSLCLILSLILIVYLSCAAGRQVGRDDLVVSWTEKIPYGILLIALGGCMLMLACLIILIARNARPGMESLWGLLLTICVLLLFLSWLLLCLGVKSTIVRLKAHCFWHYTVICYLSRPIRRLWRFCIRNLKDVPSHLPMAAVIGTIFVVLTAIEAVLLLQSGWYGEAGGLIFYLLIKLAELIVLIFIGLQLERIRKGGQRIATGNLTEPIQTDGMFWEFRRHAENINKTGDGISLAVEERMKSEHFKTELITNVSHDIKTPLTSIINYVDLMKKENITDPTLLKYMDVIDRQSARLKKLIDDLMEASKASTGNLEVHPEKCNLSVLFSQMVGEFEERASAQNLSFVINVPEEPVLIMADGRHLWRIFENLINNACKYSMPGTRVYMDLSVSTTGDAVITIKNISGAQLNIGSNELLERFVRGDSSRNTEGSGLGLSIAQSLTELMQGTLTLNIDGDLFKVILRFPRLS